MKEQMLLLHGSRVLLGGVQDGQIFPSLADTICKPASFQDLLCNLLGMSPSGFYEMSNKMLIDASHPEETRVVVTRGNRIEEFDFESEHKKQLKGNIYLARVTRVEPSLQAAFVEYGGNRHGFLAFSEIHPDYYQIPVADRLALLEAEEQAAILENDNGDMPLSEVGPGRRGRKKSSRKHKAKAAGIDGDAISEFSDTDSDDDAGNGEETIEFVGAEDALEEVSVQRAVRRDYKIQEVIKRRQILLVQIMKEERGNKGAALTTYLSLAGRYSVLMPNTARGGGISRKITSAGDRKRLKDIVKDLSVPKGMGVILRTAGANRTKSEVKRDYEYLMRLWENVRTLTLKSIAPALVYEEGSLIKRSIRDLYSKDIDEVLVAGDKGYREAKDFMRMLMPSHAKVVQPYREKLPIFARSSIETQLDRILQPEVNLKSGGYLVINQTEALVAIDVNSGRSTKEHSVEETAVQTNLEAAEEVARQLRLRDLAGLVVIDFIDMIEKRNIRSVEKKLKDCLKEDRARIQVGRISHFGLMEMSRQRIRASVLESTTQPCPHCVGTGYVRSESSVALHVLRSIEEYLQRNNSNNILVRTPVSTALYVLNNKRRALANLEEQFGLTIDIEADDAIGSQHLAIYKGTPAQRDSTSEAQSLPDEEAAAENAVSAAEKSDGDDSGEEHRKRRRRRRGERSQENAEKQADIKADKTSIWSQGQLQGEEDRKRRRSRGRRGGRRNRELDMDRRIQQAEPVGSFALRATDKETVAVDHIVPDAAGEVMQLADRETAAESFATEKESKPNRRKGRKKNASEAKTAEAVIGVSETIEQESAQKAPIKRRNRKKNSADAPQTAVSARELDAQSGEKTSAKRADAAPKAPRRKKIAAAKTKSTAAETKAAEPVVISSVEDAAEPAKIKRAGWWQRKGFF